MSRCDRRSPERSSAEQPARKRQRVEGEVLQRPPANKRSSSEHNISGSAERPARKKQRVKREVLQSPPATKNIAFISCPTEMRVDSKEGLQKLEEAVAHVLELGAIFISVTCEQTNMNMARILNELMPLVSEKMNFNDTQPEVLLTASVLSIWASSFGTCDERKTIDPEGDVPATGFFFNTNVGNIPIFTACWPTMPLRTQRSLLQAYVNETGAPVQAVIVGGSMHCSLMAADSLTAKIDAPMRFHVNGTLSVFVAKSDPENVSVIDIHTEGPFSVVAEVTSSAEQPATSSGTQQPAAEPLVLKEATPLWDAFLDKVSEADDDNAASIIVNYIAHKCFYDKLCHIDEYGEKLEKPMSLSTKMERLLTVCKRRRELHIEYLREKGDPRCSAEQPADDYFMTFDVDDMKRIYNTWRRDVHSYMQDSTLKAHETMENVRPQNARQLEKSTHGTHLFHLSGCKFLLRQFLRLPFACSAEQPATSSAAQPALHHLLEAFEQHKQSPEYRRALENSKEKEAKHVRLTKRLWWARHNHEQGKTLSFRVRAGHVAFNSFSQDDQTLAEDYEAGRSAARIKSLMEEREAAGSMNFHLLRLSS